MYKRQRENLVKILNPFAPHLAHELWERLGKPGLVEEAGWPEFDPRFLEDESVTIVIQINGKVRDRMVIPAGSTDEEVIEKALASERVMSLLGSGAQAREKVSKAVVDVYKRQTFFSLTIISSEKWLNQ